MTTFFSGRTILIISSDSWKELFVSKHHFAIELSASNLVYFLNPSTDKFELRSTEYPNLTELDYPKFIPGLRFFPSFLQRLFFRQRLAKIERMINRKFDCIWSFDNSVFFDLTFLPSKVLKISHIMDLSQNFQLRKAAITSHFCMGVSQPIVEELKKWNNKTFLLPHGVPIGRDRDVKVILPGESSIKAIFAGNLDRKHFDKNLLLHLAHKYKNVDFIFLGNGGEGWSRLSNTYYPGAVRPDHLQSYFLKADILLLPYKFNEFHNELTNSHKVLDYLKSGKVIVSTYLEDYKDKEHLLKMAKSFDEFDQLFGEVSENLELENNAERSKIRKDFTQSHSYAQRVLDVESFITQIGF